jgi:predicted TIM-barrel fold metal-dependent hydrolase
LIIVDSFTHLGECRVYDQRITDAQLLDALNANKISAAVVAPFPGAPSPPQTHDDIANFASRNPGRAFGLVNANPHVNRDLYHREVERCVRTLGFVGIVLDTFGHAVDPNTPDGQTVFEAAREFGVPIVVHTGTGAPFGLPSAVLPRAKTYSDVKIVLGHAGAGLYTGEALIVAREATNVYLETSYCWGEDVKRLVEDLGPSRVMFGSDRPVNQPVELAKYQSNGLYFYQQYNSLGQTAIDVFHLQGVTELVQEAPAPAPAATE